MNLLWKNITEDLCQAKELITQARSFCNAPGGPYLYDEALQSDLILIRAARYPDMDCSWQHYTENKSVL